jgi:hypothetical protein
MQELRRTTRAVAIEREPAIAPLLQKSTGPAPIKKQKPTP